VLVGEAENYNALIEGSAWAWDTSVYGATSHARWSENIEAGRQQGGRWADRAVCYTCDTRKLCTQVSRSTRSLFAKRSDLPKSTS